eukprot:3903733-Pyramimonas_sp.AAC.1
MGAVAPCENANEAFGGVAYGATKRVKGVPKWVRRHHANHRGAFGDHLGPSWPPEALFGASSGKFGGLSNRSGRAVASP